MSPKAYTMFRRASLATKMRLSFASPSQSVSRPSVSPGMPSP